MKEDIMKDENAVQDAVVRRPWRTPTLEVMSIKETRNDSDQVQDESPASMS